MKRRLEYPLWEDGDTMRYRWAPCYRIWTMERSGRIVVVANRPGLISLARICMSLASFDGGRPLHEHLETGTDLEDGSTELTLVREGEEAGPGIPPAERLGEIAIDVSEGAGRDACALLQLEPGEHVGSEIDGDSLTLVANRDGFIALARACMALAEPDVGPGARIELSGVAGPTVEFERAVPVEKDASWRPRVWRVWAGESWVEEGWGDARPLGDGTLLMDSRAQAFFAELCGLVASPSDVGISGGLAWHLRDVPEVDAFIREETDVARGANGDMWIRRYALATNRVAGCDLFRLCGDQTGGLYASQLLFERWVDAGLEGLGFQLVWDSNYGEQVVFTSPDDRGSVWVDGRLV